MTQGRVAGKVALVVGGGQTPGATIGNGRATALLLAREGASVAVADRDLVSAVETVELIARERGTASAIQADATEESSLEAAVRETVWRYGGLDILHNNVGASWAAGDAGPLELEEASFDRLVAINFKSAWFASRHAIPVLIERGGGSIVNISSVAARRAHGALGYKASKTALLALTEQLASRFGRQHIRVNAILPGIIDTPMAQAGRVSRGAGSPPTSRAAGIPLGRPGTAWDVAYAALFLHSDEASFITGVSLLVDGGEAVADRTV